MSDLFGRSMILLPVDPPGCLARLEGFLLAWAWWLVWVGVGVVIGVIAE
jgi:hypothetical protein